MTGRFTPGGPTFGGTRAARGTIALPNLKRRLTPEYGARPTARPRPNAQDASPSTPSSDA